MPNVKLFVDDRHLPGLQAGIAAALPAIRDMLCAALAVDLAACQIAVIPVIGLPDQPQINAELHILPHADRTPAALRQTALDLRAMVAGATGLSVAVRIATLDPATYVVLK